MRYIENAVSLTNTIAHNKIKDKIIVIVNLSKDAVENYREWGILIRTGEYASVSFKNKYTKFKEHNQDFINKVNDIQSEL